MRVPPAARSACNTCASNERPAIACSTFGRAERMRVPSPAASTTERQVLSSTIRLRETENALAEQILPGKAAYPQRGLAVRGRGWILLRFFTLIRSRAAVLAGE